MQNLHFKTFTNFAEFMHKSYKEIAKRDEDVSVIGYYEDIIEIFAALVRLGYKINTISISDPEYDNYCNEYILSLYGNEIWIEPCKRDDRYIDDFSTISFVLDSCSKGVCLSISSDISYEVTIDESHFAAVNVKNDSEAKTAFKEESSKSGTDLDSSNKVYLYHADENDKYHGFSASKYNDGVYRSCAYYTNNTLEKPDVDKIISMFGF